MSSGYCCGRQDRDDPNVNVSATYPHVPPAQTSRCYVQNETGESTFEYANCGNDTLDNACLGDVVNYADNIDSEKLNELVGEVPYGTTSTNIQIGSTYTFDEKDGAMTAGGPHIIGVGACSSCIASPSGGYCQVRTESGNKLYISRGTNFVQLRAQDLMREFDTPVQTQTTNISPELQNTMEDNQASIASILSETQTSEPVPVEQTDVVVSAPPPLPSVAASVNLQNQANQRETIKGIIKDIKREDDINQAEIKEEGISIYTIIIISLITFLLALCFYLLIKFKSMSDFTKFLIDEFDSEPSSSSSSSSSSKLSGDHVNLTKMKRSI